jgi:3-methyladenine DNA glycosylase AlkD
MPAESKPWLLTFTEAVAASERERALATLEARATAHAGTPKSAEKQAAAKEIMASCGGESEPLLGWTHWLAEQQSPTAKELLAVLLVPAYPHQRGQAVDWLQRLADDDNWEVREWAASAIGELANAHCDDWLPLLRDWVGHESQFVRRAVAVAAKYAVQKRRPGRCDELLDLIEPLVTDRAEEVRRNLGPFAVGGGFLGSCPDETLARVRRWAASDDEQSRWNAAMVFSAANARKHIDAGLEVLSGLASDRRRYVWMAVGAAARNLAKRDPDRVMPELQRWLDDDRRLPAALALRGARRPSP